MAWTNFTQESKKFCSYDSKGWKGKVYKVRKKNRRMKYDCRGFAIYEEFEDTYGAKITIKKSSSAEEEKCWIFTKGGTSNNDGSIHLSIDQAKKVIEALQTFIKQNSKGETREKTESNAPTRYKETGL